MQKLSSKLQLFLFAYVEALSTASQKIGIGTYALIVAGSIMSCIRGVISKTIFKSQGNLCSFQQLDIGVSQKLEPLLIIESHTLRLYVLKSVLSFSLYIDINNVHQNNNITKQNPTVNSLLI